MHGNRSVLPNEELSKLMHSNLSLVGGVRYDSEDLAFAEIISESLKNYFIGMEKKVMPYESRQSMGSTDVGDVSWVVPTAGMRAATWVPGTASHSWQAIAAGGTNIGIKGMTVAAKTLALTARELYLNPALIEAASKEFHTRRGENFRYESLLGDRDPPLDYRVN